MSRLLMVLLVCLAVVLLLPVVAAADQIDEWNALIAEANAVSGEYDALDAQNARLAAKIGQIDPAGKHAADALPILAAMDGNFSEMARDRESFATLADQMSKLDVSEEMKTYATLQQELNELTSRYVAVEADLVAGLTVFYSRAGRVSQARLAELNDLIAREQELISQVTTKRQAAEQYYTDMREGLSTASAEARALGFGAGVDLPNVAGQATGAAPNRGVLVVSGIVSLVVAGVFAVVCGFLARRKKRSVAGWAILGFLFPIIALVVVLVLSEKKPKRPKAAGPTRPPHGAHPVGT